MAAQTGVPQATAYIVGGTTTSPFTVKPANGVLFTVSVTAGSAQQLDIYDNTTNSGNKLYSNSVSAGTVVLFNSPFQIGLTISFTATTNIAVSYA